MLRNEVLGGTLEVALVVDVLFENLDRLGTAAHE